MKFTSRLATASAIALFVGATAASALTFNPPIKDASAGGDNQGVNEVYGAGTNTRNGWYGADLFLVGGPADIDVTYLGAEAGFENQFSFQNTLVATTEGTTGAGNWTGTATQSFTNVASGLLKFFFTINGGNGGATTVANGSNVDNSGGGAAPDFFVSFVNENAGFGKEVILWLDDGGTDDNHDDMAVRMTITSGGDFAVVPLPAAGWLLIAGIGGLAAMRRKKKAA